MKNSGLCHLDGAQRLAHPVVVLTKTEEIYQNKPSSDNRDPEEHF